jgi:hypothetical protein
MKRSGNEFYKKFVNEENFTYISAANKKIFYLFCVFLIVFSYIPVILSTFTPFTFKHILGTLTFLLAMFSEAIAILSFIGLVILDRKNGFFKKRYHVYVLFLSFFVISVAGILSGHFNSSYTFTENGGFSAKFNPGYFFFLFTPLYLANIIFNSFACLSFFRKSRKIPNN